MTEGGFWLDFPMVWWVVFCPRTRRSRVRFFGRLGQASPVVGVHHENDADDISLGLGRSSKDTTALARGGCFSKGLGGRRG